MKMFSILNNASFASKKIIFNASFIVVLLLHSHVGAQGLSTSSLNSAGTGRASAVLPPAGASVSPSVPAGARPSVVLPQGATSERISNTDGKIGKTDKDSDTDSARTKKVSKKGERDQSEIKDRQPTAFEQFVAESTGNYLPIFGLDYFYGAPDYVSATNIPVTEDYLLGPGDDLIVRGWGTLDMEYSVVIDRNGMISIPKVGNIQLAGARASEAEKIVRAAIDKYYRGVNLSVTLGKLKSLTVYVSGQALRPGAYILSSLSTLVTALFASGGPNANGSLRRIQVKRGGKVAAEMDMYAFMVNGDKSADIKLRDGDVIYIPPAHGFVAITGTVTTPAIYEIRSESETVESMLRYAGGLPVVADPRVAFLERIDADIKKPRSIEQIALDTEGLSKILKNGDLLTITSITPEFSNAITLRGMIRTRVPFKFGMTVHDLIPSRENLITRASIQKRNDAIRPDDRTQLPDQVGDIIDQVNLDFASIERIDHHNLKAQVLSFNLGKAIDFPDGPDNLMLEPGDIVTVYSYNDVKVPIERRQVFVRVEGEVKRPGIYQVTRGETLKDVLAKAGGLTGEAYLFGLEFYRDRAQLEQEANLQRLIQRTESQLAAEVSARTSNLGSLDPSVIQAQLQSQQGVIDRLKTIKPTGRIALGLREDLRADEDFPLIKLENSDKIIIPARPDFVSIYGSVNIENALIWRPGLKVQDVIERAGPGRWADLSEVFVIQVDGSIKSKDSSSWFSGILGSELKPGDTIVVPEKVDKETFYNKLVRGLKDWAQILTGFGLSAAAVYTLTK